MSAPPETRSVIELRVLGPPRIDASDGRPLDGVVRQPKRVALLAYLAMARPRGAHRRDKLVSLFWPESDATHARAALNQALYVLRSHLGEVFLRRGADEVELDPSATWCDALAFEEALDAGREDEALERYAGDLLDGFHIAGAPEFERWVDEERRRLRQRASDGAWRLAETRAAAGRTVEAERWARCAADLMPADETVVRRLMLFLRGLGDRAAAMRAYDAFVHRLSMEFDLAPSPETRALASAIRDEDRPVSPPPLEGVAEVPAERTLVRVARPWRSTVTTAGAVAVAVLVVGTWAWTRSPETVVDSRLIALLDFGRSPPLAAGTAGNTIDFARTGDFVYVGRDEHGRGLFLKPKNRRHASAIPRTAGALQPFFSPNGEWIGHVVGGVLRKIHLTGTPVEDIVRIGRELTGASWGDDDTIVFATPAGLHRVPASGGDVETIVLADTARGESFRWPHMLPGSRAALVTRVTPSGFELVAVTLSTGEVHPLGVRGTSPRYVVPGYVVYARRDGTLLAARFDARALRFTGDPIQVATDVHVGMSGAAKIGVASDALAYVPSGAGGTMEVVDTLGRARPVPIGRRRFGSARFSADGRRVVTAIKPLGVQRADIWLVDLAANELRQLTFDSANVGPIVSRSAPERIAFAKWSGVRPGFEIRWIATDSTSAPEPLLPAAAGQQAREITRDGRSLIFQRLDPETSRDIWVLSLDGSGRITPYLRGPANERAPTLAPSERWVAWASDESGRDEIWVGEFPGLRTRVRISTAGGTEPQWGPDGRTLYYRGSEGMTAIEFDPETGRPVGTPRVLFDDSPFLESPESAAYDVHPDGDRFVMIRVDDARENLLLWLGRLEDLRPLDSKS